MSTRKHIFTQEETDDIIFRYQNNESIRSIFRSYNSTYIPIKRILVENNAFDKPTIELKPNEKLCSGCHTPKDYSEFYKCKTNKTGYKSQCKECLLKANRQYQSDNKEVIKKRSKQYQLDNKEKLNKISKQYYEQNKGIISKKGKEYYKENKEHREKKLKQAKIYRSDPKVQEHIKEQSKKYRAKNKETIKEKDKIYYIKNKENIKQKSSNHYYNNKDKIKEYRETEEYKANRNKKRNERRKTDTNYKLTTILRKRIKPALKTNTKHTPTLELIGCTIEELKIHLQKTADINYPNENFDINNYSGKDWHIDHIKPCSSFNLEDPEEQKKCFHYTNLQILTAKDNLEKHTKY